VHPAACSAGQQLALRLLPGAQHHVVHRQHTFLVADADVQAGVINLLVLHAGRHADAAALSEVRWIQPVVLPRLVAHLALPCAAAGAPARRSFHLRQAQAAAMGIGGVNAPLGIELGGIHAGLVPLCIRYSDTSKPMPPAPMTPRSCPPAFVAQHVQIAQHLGVVDTFNGRRTRRHAGGQHDVVEFARLEFIGCVTRVFSTASRPCQLDLAVGSSAGSRRTLPCPAPAWRC
jgi:hypothetical protein